MWLLTCTLLLAPSDNETAHVSPDVAVVLVVGEPGEDQYQKQFTQWAKRWQDAAKRSSARLVTIGLDDSQQDRPSLEETLASLAKAPPQSLWLVMIGHGTFDGKKAKFNLRGTDISAAELTQALSPISCRMAIINCASASGPFVNQLSGPDRVVVAATQSGFEYNFARFGDFMSQTISDTSGDLDKDGQTSLLEAWLAAAKQTQTYYDSQSQLATEHALLDDNGDGKGTPADWFRGIYVTKSSKDGSIPDGTLANQFILVPSQDEAQLSEELIEKRDQLERQLAELRQKKSQLNEEEYLDSLQAILVPLAKIYQPNVRSE
ncbi:hypothetical protein C5Y96_22925 [Blastopirellula marina]|uniref:Caspase family p20 domain-containing protein n=1 Tax=Blastopirellula marina TaxID=124 RepID=A0A2S8F144_9BACT|nr:hypothetical protein C5Y96_22925 [Blastopirellula marina]RCS43510.1 hypothetical protein DTL36_22975 [Bremerella cremea]